MTSRRLPSRFPVIRAMTECDERGNASNAWGSRASDKLQFTVSSISRTLPYVMVAATVLGRGHSAWGNDVPASLLQRTASASQARGVLRLRAARAHDDHNAQVPLRMVAASDKMLDVFFSRCFALWIRAWSCCWRRKCGHGASDVIRQVTAV